MAAELYKLIKPWVLKNCRNPANDPNEVAYIAKEVVGCIASDYHLYVKYNKNYWKNKKRSA